MKLQDKMSAKQPAASRMYGFPVHTGISALGASSSSRQMPDWHFGRCASRLLPAGIPYLLLMGTMLLVGPRAGFGQVSPAEIINPQLKAAEKAYLAQLIQLNRAIGSTKFAFPFLLSRYVGLDPASKLEADTRGIEFVNFQDQMVLKITGNYGAAFSAERLTQNQRASRIFEDVVVPILHLLPGEISPDVSCDRIGFEISYHVRTQAHSYDYEGKEDLVVVLAKDDAFHFVQSDESARQEILNRSQVYVNGEKFGLALGERDAFNLEAVERSAPPQPAPLSAKGGDADALSQDRRLARLDPGPSAELDFPNRQAGEAASIALPSPASRLRELQPKAANAPAMTPAEAERLQAKYQPQLDALAKEGLAKFHFVEYAPPAFVIFRNQVLLQFTLRNPLHFDRETSSIYKRAAQSFDLFLAPQLKDLLAKIPAGTEFAGVDITVLNQLAAEPAPSSEAVEFICPLEFLRQFVDAAITNQDLINQSVVLVNGVRIALNLQQVE